MTELQLVYLLGVLLVAIGIFLGFYLALQNDSSDDELQ